MLQLDGRDPKVVTRSRLTEGEGKGNAKEGKDLLARSSVTRCEDLLLDLDVAYSTLSQNEMMWESLTDEKTKLRILASFISTTLSSGCLISLNQS